MLSKEEVETCKEEAREYIDFVKDRDNAGWLKGLLWYIEQLEADNYEANNIINNYIEDRQKLIEKLEEDIDKDNKELRANDNSITYRNIVLTTRILAKQEVLNFIRE